MRTETGSSLAEYEELKMLAYDMPLDPYMRSKVRNNKQAMSVMHKNAIAKRRKRRFLFGKS